MYQNSGTGKTYYGGIGIDTALMAANDIICQGALPVVYTDEVAAGDSDWFYDLEIEKDRLGDRLAKEIHARLAD